MKPKRRKRKRGEEKRDRLLQNRERERECGRRGWFKVVKGVG